MELGNSGQDFQNPVQIKKPKPNRCFWKFLFDCIRFQNCFYIAPDLKKVDLDREKNKRKEETYINFFKGWDLNFIS